MAVKCNPQPGTLKDHSDLLSSCGPQRHNHKVFQDVRTAPQLRNFLLKSKLSLAASIFVQESAINTSSIPFHIQTRQANKATTVPSD